MKPKSVVILREVIFFSGTITGRCWKAWKNSVCCQDILLHRVTLFRTRFHPRLFAHSFKVVLDPEKNESGWLCDVSRLGRQDLVSVTAKGFVPGIVSGIDDV